MKNGAHSTAALIVNNQDRCEDLGVPALHAFGLARKHVRQKCLTGHVRRGICISMNIEIASSQMESLGNPTRLRIYRTLVRAGFDGLPVGGLQQRLEIPASTLSHHCRKLIDAGLVTQERNGTTLICRANYKAMSALIGYLADECCADGRCEDVEAAAVA